MTHQSSTATHFWPETYEERGVAVPFTTPSLSMARVRLNARGQLELLISGLSGGRGVYIIGWKGVAETFKLTVFDRVLHEHVSLINEVSPAQVRDAVLMASATGLAGENVAAAAYSGNSSSVELQLRTSLALTRHVLKSVLNVDLDIGLAELASPAGQKNIQAHLGRIAKLQNIPPEQMLTALAEWSDQLVFTGVPGYQPIGRYRKTLEDADHFLSSFRDWLRTSGIRRGNPARIIGEVLDETLPAWIEAFDEIDALAADPLAPLKDWQKFKPRLETLIQRVPWLIDGWPLIFSLWETALRGTQEHRHDAVKAILSGLPFLPKTEADPNSHRKWQDMAKQLSLFAAKNTIGSQNDIKIDGMLRQERVLARTLG